ncbi:hypothetical protein IscW_ISCW004154 [Ixodes scapularis]|uniref:Secreted protein n=1 Tax=Ixodes scapularis TaxID=6945 RepID=B7PHA8_IXOSC|nr:hypothetical protein IscW_ISCW004154 [Ixodes scapularis]|eukprot:XP_002402424.1 hypothetical protein IscW_ISCW004154 [Ixodes scapularis]
MQTFYFALLLSKVKALCLMISPSGVVARYLHRTSNLRLDGFDHRFRRFYPINISAQNFILRCFSFQLTVELSFSFQLIAE